MRHQDASRSHRHAAAAIVAVLVLLFYGFVLERRVPLLGSADLGFHELGHLITRPFGQTFSFVMGSGTQVLVPLGLASYFWLTRRDPQAAFLLGWAATSMQDVSVYIADAPYELLPLIGGEHDWAFLLTRWNAIDQADTIARTVWYAGLVIGVVGVGLAASPFVRTAVVAVRARRPRKPRHAGTIREPRPTRWLDSDAMIPRLGNKTGDRNRSAGD